MASVMVPAGTLREEWELLGGGLARLRVLWAADAVVAGNWLTRPLVGVLHRVVGRSAGGYDADAYLYTELGWDAFNGWCSGAFKLLGVGSEHKPHYLLDGSDRPRPIAVAGDHFLRIEAGGVAQSGVLDLYYYTDLRYALAERVMF